MRILVAALNWGLGHATRCVPIVKTLEKLGVEPFLASDGEALSLLQMEFPHLSAIELPSYAVHYKGNNMFWNIAPQLPKLLRVLELERRFLADIISRYKIDALISDNRYGLWHRGLPSVFLSHQVHIRIPNPLLSWGVNGLAKKMTRKFDEYWVPDFPTPPGLSGNLGHFSSSKPLRYIGPLSRLDEAMLLGLNEEVYDIVALLSGPEPQRSYLEKILLAQLQRLPLRCLLVRGKPSESDSRQWKAGVEIRSYLPAPQVAFHLSQAGLVLARSGYSTIMDMAKIGCQSALLIPTPGQTEQEYLAKMLLQQGQVQMQRQQQINVKEAWAQRQQYTGWPKGLDNELLEGALAEWISKNKK